MFLGDGSGKGDRLVGVKACSLLGGPDYIRGGGDYHTTSVLVAGSALLQMEVNLLNEVSRLFSLVMREGLFRQISSPNRIQIKRRR